MHPFQISYGYGPALTSHIYALYGGYHEGIWQSFWLIAIHANGKLYDEYEIDVSTCYTDP